MSFQSLLIIPTIVLGAAGAGKTTELVRRCMLLFEERNFTFSDLCVVNYTRKANEVFLEKLFEKMGLPRPRNRRESRFTAPYIDTLHGLTWRLCDFKAGQKSSDTAREEFVKLEFGFSEDDQPRSRSQYHMIFEDAKMILEAERHARICVKNASLQDVEQFVLRYLLERSRFKGREADSTRNTVRRVLRSYDRFKKERDLIDYEDVLTVYAQRGRQPDFKVLIIDEAQDINPLQYDVINRLAAGPRVEEVIFAGDDDQAIYTWMGVDPMHFVKMQGYTSRLEQSYRVPALVSSAASRLIGKIDPDRRKGNRLLPRDFRGVLDRRSQFDPDIIDVSQSTTILARTHSELRKIRSVLIEYSLPYVYRTNSEQEEKFTSQEIMSAIETYCEVQRTGLVDKRQALILLPYLGNISEEQTATLLALYEKKINLNARIFSISTEKHWSSILRKIDPVLVAHLGRMTDRALSISSPKLRLSTIHGFKGGEDEHVIYCCGQSASASKTSLFDRDAEIRTSYVAMTRARSRLTVCGGGNSPDYLTSDIFK